MLNIAQLFQMVRASKNPAQMIEQALGNNPLYMRAKEMANGKSESELKQTIQNICDQKGLNLNEMMNNFKNIFGIK